MIACPAAAASRQEPEETETELAELRVAVITEVDWICMVHQPAQMDVKAVKKTAEIIDARMKIQFLGDLQFTHVLDIPPQPDGLCLFDAMIPKEQARMNGER